MPAVDNFDALLTLRASSVHLTNTYMVFGFYISKYYGNSTTYGNRGVVKLEYPLTMDQSWISCCLRNISNNTGIYQRLDLSQPCNSGYNRYTRKHSDNIFSQLHIYLQNGLYNPSYGDRMYDFRGYNVQMSKIYHTRQAQHQDCKKYAIVIARVYVIACHICPNFSSISSMMYLIVC